MNDKQHGYRKALTLREIKNMCASGLGCDDCDFAQPNNKCFFGRPPEGWNINSISTKYSNTLRKETRDLTTANVS
jgi:hypothetical protein